ncbi:MAG: hypothetical protein ACR2MW_10595 [Chthoniobacterales bacterium]
MQEEISPAEAERSLREVEDSRATMRRAIRAHRGHLYLWLWGGVWIAMALLVYFRGQRGFAFFPWLIFPAMILSFAFGAFQSRQIRAPIDKRFLGALASILAFGVLWPVVLGGFGHPPNDMRSFAFICLLVMQVYVLAGIWFDNYLLIIGLFVSALILIGLFLFPHIFWIWFAVFCGGPIFLSGFLVRYGWR